MMAGGVEAGLVKSRPRPLSAEMRSLLEALQARTEGQLPGLEAPVVVRFIGGRYWQIEGAPRCWQTETIHALYRRRRIERVSPMTYRAKGGA